jgi:hypothetical protein
MKLDINTQIEVWKDIKGYEGLYQISDMGRVKSLDRAVPLRNGSKQYKKGRILKPIATNGATCKSFSTIVVVRKNSIFIALYAKPFTRTPKTSLV